MLKLKKINAMSEKVLETNILGLSVSTWGLIVGLIAFFMYMRTDIDSLRQGQELARQERINVVNQLIDYKKEVSEQRKSDREDTRELLKEIKESLRELRAELKKDR